MENETENGMVERGEYPAALTIDPIRVGMALLFVPRNRQVYELTVERAEELFDTTPGMPNLFKGVMVTKSMVEELNKVEDLPGE